MESNEETFYLSQQPTILQNGILKPHQLIGLNWLISMYKIGFNGILADEMGLGKTIQAIAFFGYLKQYENIKGPFLIVSPNSVVSNWKRELKKWLPDLNVVKLIARKEYRQEIIENYLQCMAFDVVVTSYEGINICLKDLKKISWKYIVVDEAHRIKNDQSILSQNLRGLKTEMKLLITGTPLQNNLKELWALLNFIMPELFDDAEVFTEITNKNEDKTQEQLEKENIELINSLHKILRPFLLKRTKAVIDQSIPPKKEIHLYVGLTKTQTEIYKNLLLKRFPTDHSNKSSMLNVLMQLRKACNHPYLFQGVEDETQPAHGDHLFETSGKMIILNKLLEKLKYNHQVLIFSQFTSMLDILEDYLNYKEFKYCRIDGNTFLEEREEQILEFTREGSDKFVFLLSTRAGGLGINLTSADTVILYDSDWNPQVDLQAMDRAHRIGQTKNVNVYRLITENTIEEKIIERQNIKLKWDQLVILKGKMTQKQKMSKEELKDLVQYGSKIIFKAENGTLQNYDLDLLLERGMKRAEELNKKIDNYINKNNEKLFDLGINSINVYEFEGADYNEKRKEDQEIIHQKLTEQYEQKKLQKRIGIQTKYEEKQVIQPKIAELPDYHFYPNKDELERILTKEANKEELTEEEKKNKTLWKSQGMINFNKNDYFAIIRSLEKYDLKDLKSISEYVKKEEKEVKLFLEKMMKNLNKLPEKEKIEKNIQRFLRNIENKEKSSKILAKKCAGIERFQDLTFEQSLYNKVRSKFYSPLQDKFLIYQAYLYGENNYKEIKKILIDEKIFRFDYYLRGVKDSLLKKRIQSLIKMLENEQELLQRKQEDEQNNVKKNKKEVQKEIVESSQGSYDDQSDGDDHSQDEEEEPKNINKKHKIKKTKPKEQKKKQPKKKNNKEKTLQKNTSKKTTKKQQKKKVTSKKQQDDMTSGQKPLTDFYQKSIKENEKSQKKEQSSKELEKSDQKPSNTTL